MMDIMVTISPLIEKAELDLAIKQCINKGISNVRINVAKIFHDAAEKRVLENISYIKKKIDGCSILIDCAYPRLKSRIHINSLKVIKNQEYYYIQQSNNIAEQENVISIDNLSDDIQINQVLFYGDGEGGFKVLGKEKNRILVQSMGDFAIYDSKTITNSNLRTSKSYNDFIYRLCDLVRPSEVAFSFVEEKDDLIYPLKLQKEFKFSIVSKIETEKGIDNLADIADSTDKIMIGRGDLGLYSDISKLYQEQLEIFSIARRYNKEVYVATDILDSLNRRYLPSRADIIDLSVLLENRPQCVILNYSIVYNQKVAYAVEIFEQIKSKMNINRKRAIKSLV